MSADASKTAAAVLEAGGEPPGSRDERVKALVGTASSLVSSVENTKETLLGRQRLLNKALAERAFFERCLAQGTCPEDKADVGVNNLPHLEAVVGTCAAVAANGVLRQFGNVLVDVTAEVDGHPVWIKCIARAASGFLQAEASEQLLETGRTWLEVARQRPEHGLTPHVCFRFFAGLLGSVAESLRDLGIDVQEGFAAPEPPRLSADAVNLDTTAMIALASNLSHGHVGWTFEDPALENQASQEESSSVLRQMVPFLSGRKLLASSSAVATFKKIVDTMAGPRESERARHILQALTVIKAEPASGLVSSRKLSASMKDVLGAAAEHGVPTVTANSKVVRALADQGCSLQFLEHMPRALTEGKEISHASRCSRTHCLEAAECRRLFVAMLSSSEEQVKNNAGEQSRDPGLLRPDSLDSLQEQAGHEKQDSSRLAEASVMNKENASGGSESATSVVEDPSAVRKRTALALDECNGGLSELQQIHTMHAADETYSKLCDECLNALRLASQTALSTPDFYMKPFDTSPDVQLQQFGSSKQGTALMSSDLDVCLSFEQFSVKGKDRQLHYLRGVAADPGEHFTVIQVIEAALPLVRLRFQDSNGQGLDVDMSMGSKQGEVESIVDAAVLGILAAGGEGASCFVRLVKVFAKAHGLVNAFAGYLNSVSWVFLALSFLQTLKCVPAYDDLGKAEAQLKPVVLNADLFARFFAFVIRCSGHVVSLSKVKGQLGPHLSRNGNKFLNVRHPTMQELNLAHSLRDLGWQQTLSRCKWAEDVIVAATKSHDEAVTSSAIRRCFRLEGDAGDNDDNPELPHVEVPKFQNHRAKRRRWR